MCLRRRVTPAQRCWRGRGDADDASTPDGGDDHPPTPPRLHGSRFGRELRVRAGQLKCGDTCRNVGSDPQHCGPATTAAVSMSSVWAACAGWPAIHRSPSADRCASICRTIPTTAVAAAMSASRASVSKASASGPPPATWWRWAKTSRATRRLPDDCSAMPCSFRSPIP